MKKTNLRRLRHRYGMSLTELARAAGLSNQYISWAELGKTAATPTLEARLSCAVEKIIALRRENAAGLEQDYLACRGELLRSVEVESDEL